MGSNFVPAGFHPAVSICGDKNPAKSMLKIPPVFVPLPEICEGLVGERRVGGLNAWHSESAQIMSAPVPSILQEFQPTIFRASSLSFARKSEEEAREMVGWNPCKILRPRFFREVELATIPGPRPTHPTLHAPEPTLRQLPQHRIRRKKTHENEDHFHCPDQTI